jgi:CubicO group peptidase (beta-lactamase class C family)
MAAAAAGQTQSLPSVVEDDKLKELAKSIVETYDLPGICVAIVEGDRRVRIAAHGIRKAGREQQLTIQDRFHIGSCTKAMTATVIAGVVRDTKLEWDSTIQDALPRLGRICHPELRKATLRQLLDHRSGLAANSDLMWRVNGKLSTTEQRRELFTTVLKAKPAAPPGSRYEYSNLGYMLAALMAETAAQSSWEQLIERYVFGPLDMKSAGFGPPASGQQADQPWGHTREAGKLVPTSVDNPPVLGPAGTVHCSVADWARFAALHLGHSPAGPRTTGAKAAAPLDPDTIRFLHTPVDEADYAFGWIVAKRDWARGTVLTHAGSNRSWYASVWIAPQLDRAFLAVTNTGQDNAAEACDTAIAKLVGAAQR